MLPPEASLWNFQLFVLPLLSVYLLRECWHFLQHKEQHHHNHLHFNWVLILASKLSRILLCFKTLNNTVCCDHMPRLGGLDKLPRQSVTHSYLLNVEVNIKFSDVSCQLFCGRSSLPHFSFGVYVQSCNIRF